ncbi:histidine phosphatase family protein [Williamsia sp. MIQD14]|uniref:histidine phosphatase family protein n=1 Tax=Williamsia sp. MIQD14 TaxID=3425703 RepID=UPI003DA01E19
MDGAGSRVRRRPDPPGPSGHRRAGHPARYRAGPLTVRLVAAARSAPNRALRFGAESSGLDDRGRRDAQALGETLGDRTDAILSGPEASVLQTAHALGGGVNMVPELRSIDLGSWTGRAPEEIPAGELALWFGDVESVPHGGESVAAFVARIALWFAPRIGASASAPSVHSAPAAVVVVAKPVVQAVVAHLGTAGVAGYFSVDIRPASVHTLTDGSVRPGL